MPLRCQCYHQRATLWRSGSIGTQWAARSARSVWWAEQREQDRDEGKRQNVCGREKNTKQKVRRDNWVGGHETEMYSEGVCACLCVWTWGLCMRSCISSGVSRCVKALIRSRALASVCAHVYACAFVCLKTIPLPHYPVSSSPALMRSLTITVVIKVKPRPKHRIRHTRQTHTLWRQWGSDCVCTATISNTFTINSHFI